MVKVLKAKSRRSGSFGEKPKRFTSVPCTETFWALPEGWMLVYSEGMVHPTGRDD
jgi:hypothetical protein